MFGKRSFLSFSIFLISHVVVLTRGHPDCNHKRVLNQFLYMCQSYSPNSIKREINHDGAFGAPSSEDDQNNGEGQQPQLVPLYPQNFEAFVPRLQNPLYPLFPSGALYPLRDPSDDSPYEREESAIKSWERIRVPPSIPNEPEDFASFNEYYLNPVYADSDWQKAIERWRRKSHIKDEIWRFVQNKCCVTGCPFPEDYWELDKKLNICGMR